MSFWPKGYPHWADLWIRSGWRVQQHGPLCRLLDPAGSVIHRGERQACLALARRLAPHAGGRHSVILLHGLGQWRRSMRLIGRALESRGFVVAETGYASLTLPFEAHVAAVRQVAAALVEDGAETVSIVGHSLGGLVGRAAMAGPWPPGRLVQLGSPNQGSGLARRLGSLRLYRQVFGPSGQFLASPHVAALPVPPHPVLVVAGTGIPNPLIGGDGDGTVALAETRLDGACISSLRIRTIHAGLPHHRRVRESVQRFLENQGDLEVPPLKL